MEEQNNNILEVSVVEELKEMFRQADEDAAINKFYSETTRRQRRALARKTKKDYAKAEFNFEKWVSKLKLDEIEKFQNDFKIFDQHQFKISKQDYDQLLRGLVSFNYKSREWTAWQMEIFNNYKLKYEKV